MFDGSTLSFDKHAIAGLPFCTKKRKKRFVEIRNVLSMNRFAKTHNPHFFPRWKNSA